MKYWHCFGDKIKKKSTCIASAIEPGDFLGLIQEKVNPSPGPESCYTLSHIDGGYYSFVVCIYAHVVLL